MRLQSPGLGPRTTHTVATRGAACQQAALPQAFCWPLVACPPQELCTPWGLECLRSLPRDWQCKVPCGGVYADTEHKAPCYQVQTHKVITLT